MRAAGARMLSISSTGWDGPGLIESGGVDLSYWDLHGFLLLPTVWLLTAGRPTMLGETRDPLTRQASFAYIAFILTIAVGQAFIWDSVGAQIGIWEVRGPPRDGQCQALCGSSCVRAPLCCLRVQFNPAKCTGLGAATLLPLEEVLWLFHHVVKAALWQLKMSEWSLTSATEGAPGPMPSGVRTAGNGALLVLFLGGVAALVGDTDSAKCGGLIAAFFAPVFGIVWNLGSRYWRSHWRLFVAGWLPPGAWTVAIDCVGQQQGVWYFPPKYLSGINTLPDGLLKLDIAAVYLVSTFAVTATGAIILAASAEFSAQRRAATAAVSAAPAVAAPAAVTRSGAVAVGDDATGPVPTLWDFGLFIFDGASPRLAERMAEILPPATSTWRVVDASTALPEATADTEARDRASLRRERDDV